MNSAQFKIQWCPLPLIRNPQNTNYTFSAKAASTSPKSTIEFHPNNRTFLLYLRTDQRAKSPLERRNNFKSLLLVFLLKKKAIRKVQKLTFAVGECISSKSSRTENTTKSHKNPKQPRPQTLHDLEPSKDLSGLGLSRMEEQFPHVSRPSLPRSTGLHLCP